MCFFKVIVPNYNSGEWITKCIDSILNQSFTDFEVVITDDMSTDNSFELVKKYTDKRIHLLPLSSKRYNGGSRNVGIDFPIESKYTLFVDSDDWFCDNDVFQIIYDKIIECKYPDCVSLSYNCLIGNNACYQKLERNSPEELVASIYVACWTKCIKSELLVHFPENTLMEDVVQNIKQCDVLNSVVSIDKPCIVWNRNNINSCSKEENQDLQSGKWQSSMYRYAADLMDLVCNHDYCEEHRKWRLQIVLQNIKDGKYIQ